MKLRLGYWLALGVLLAIPGLLRLQFDVDVLNTLPANIPAVEGLRLHQKYFSDAQELMITLESPDAEFVEQAVRSLAGKLRAQANLVRGVVWQPPWMEDPAGAAELIAYLWINQLPNIFGDLTNRLSPAHAPAVLRETRTRLATTFSPSELARLPHDPFHLMELPDALSSAGDPEMFASPDGTFRLMFVQSAVPLRNYRACARWLAQVQAIVNAWEPARALNIRYTGAPAFTAEIAGGMERDMSTSSLGTMATISVLFWLAHRRLRPLLWLIVLLVLVLIGTLSLGGWLIGTLNVVSLGFAAILLGLGVDYALMLYQEWRANPQQSIRDARKHVSRGIFWSVISTASAFLLLNLSGLPGLGQLGTLVGCGVALAAVVMVAAYLPPLSAMESRLQPAGEPDRLKPRIPGFLGWLGTIFLVVAGIWVFLTGLPKVDHTSEPLRPRRSQAFAALQQVKERIGTAREPLWIIFRGKTETDVAERMRAATPLLEKFVAEGKLTQFELPTAIWPMPSNQAVNAAAAKTLARELPSLRDAATNAGFAPSALEMTERILSYFAGGATALPTNFYSQWMLGKLMAVAPGQAVALGLADPNQPAIPEMTQALQAHGALLAGWDILGPSLLELVRKEMRFIVPLVLLVVGLALGLAFRNARDVLLTLAAGSLSAITLMAVMRLAGWSWNLMNLLAVPLLLGAGVDHAIHMLLALRRNGGDWARTYRTTGRALLLTGGTALAGFGSLAWSSNAGLASLGIVCAAGIGAVTFVSVFLLPVWWRGPSGALNRPSSLYQAGCWQLGIFAVRVLPLGLCLWLSRTLAGLYWHLARARRNTIINNLMPAFGNRATAQRTARGLIRQFSVKLVDLWRLESGQQAAFADLIGWEHFTKAHARGKGVLLVTPHLGNWEFGGPLLTQRGIKLHVVTLLEPGQGFTELRQRFRARWGIETLVIGHDAFAAVEIVKRLQDGATVALLVDRPPAPSAVTVKLFGRPFNASVAAAELARASGCAVVPVILPRTSKGYMARVLPELRYDRAALGKREGREAFTAEIMRAFEPAIRQYIDQWYHFVPVWPE